MEITKNLKNEKDLDIILKELSESDNILRYSKREWLSLNNIFYGYIENQIVGAGTVKKINNEWFELATVIILKEFRNHGYGEQIFEHYYSLFKDKKLYASTRNPKTQSWLIEKGFKEIKFFSLPKEILLYLLKNKIKFHKLKDLIFKGLKGNWKYYIKY